MKASENLIDKVFDLEHDNLSDELLLKKITSILNNIDNILNSKGKKDLNYYVRQHKKLKEKEKRNQEIINFKEQYFGKSSQMEIKKESVNDLSLNNLNELAIEKDSTMDSISIIVFYSMICGIGIYLNKGYTEALLYSVVSFLFLTLCVCTQFDIKSLSYQKIFEWFEIRKKIKHLT